MPRYKPLVSIILTTYNRKELLKRSLQSALQQTYDNLEILVVDDGSKDNIKNYVQDLRDKRIRYFYKDNAGVASARNLGIKKASGKFITFLDDDDEYLPEKINLQIEFLEKNVDLDFCFGNFFIIEDDRKYLYLSKIPSLKYIDMLLYKTPITTQTVLFRKRVIEEVGYFDENFKICDDFDYWLRAAKRFEYGYINRPLANYYIQPKRLTENILKVSREDGLVRLKHLKKNKKFFLKSRSDDYYWLMNFHKGKEFYFQGKYKQARKLLIQAVKHKPLKLKSLIFYLQTYLKLDLFLTGFFYIHLNIERLEKSFKSHLSI